MLAGVQFFGWLLSLLAAILLTLLQYGWIVSQIRNKTLQEKRWFIPFFLRFIAWFILFILLQSPWIRITRSIEVKPKMVLYLDSSESVSSGYKSMFQLTANRLIQELPFWDIEKKYFGSDVRVAGISAIDASGDKSWVKASNFQRVVEDLAQEKFKHGLEAAVLMSDGIANSGQLPTSLKSPEGVMVSAFGVGDTALYADVFVKSLLLNKEIYIGNSGEMELVVGVRNVTSVVTAVVAVQGVTIGTQSFKPTGKYRIKTRNVFDVVKGTDTESLTHKVDTDSLAAEWSGKKWTSTAGTFTDDSSVFTLKEVEVSKDKNPYNLLNPIPRSMMTIFAPNATEKPNPDSTKPNIVTPNEIYSIATSQAKFLSGESFAIGTNMYFPLLVDPVSKKATGNQKTISGLALSLSSDNKSGYLLTIGTSQNATVDKNYRDVNFYKIVNGKLEKMTTSQRETDGTIITNINGGELYRVDIKANYSIPQGGTTKVLALKISINNKIIAVVDTSPLTITEKVGLLSLQGISAFDYVYTTSIPKEEFLSKDDYNLYKGFLGASSSVIKTFGDFIFNQGAPVENVSWLKEFGPVARELKRIKTRYTSPGFPKYSQLVNNDDVTIVGSSLDSFTMDTFVLNNTGAFTDLANGQEKQFIVVGDFITASDQFEYIDPNLTDAEKQEQVGFDSTWIQKEDEAKSLAKWMTDQWSKQQKVLTIQTFINPLIQVGDIVEVSYPENKIYSSEDTSIPAPYTASKFVVLSVDNTYDNASPPTTSLVCRSIYTG